MRPQPIGAVCIESSSERQLSDILPAQAAHALNERPWLRIAVKKPGIGKQMLCGIRRLTPDNPMHRGLAQEHLEEFQTVGGQRPNPLNMPILGVTLNMGPEQVWVGVLRRILDSNHPPLFGVTPHRDHRILELCQSVRLDR